MCEWRSHLKPDPQHSTTAACCRGGGGGRGTLWCICLSAMLLRSVAQQCLMHGTLIHCQTVCTYVRTCLSTVGVWVIHMHIWHAIATQPIRSASCRAGLYTCICTYEYGAYVKLSLHCNYVSTLDQLLQFHRWVGSVIELGLSY